MAERVRRPERRGLNGLFQPAQPIATTSPAVTEARLAVSTAGHAVAMCADDGGTRASGALSAPAKVIWALGDGGYASGATTTISYRTPGTRQVTARARDAAGNVRTVTRTIVVQP